MNWGTVIVWSFLFILIYIVNHYIYNEWLKIIGFIVSFIVAHYIGENAYRVWDKFKRK